MNANSTVRKTRGSPLDAFVFDHIRAAITHPDQLLAGEQAVTLTTPIPDDELLSAELARLDRKIEAADTERRLLIDLYQGGFIELPEMQRRATEVSSRRKELEHAVANFLAEITEWGWDDAPPRRLLFRSDLPRLSRPYRGTCPSTPTAA